MTIQDQKQAEGAKKVTAARGGELRCKGWRQEGLLRMLENVLEVGERPEDLIVYASLAKAARNWPAYYAIREALHNVADDETLIIQSGKPIAIFRTTVASPVVIMATNNTVGRFATSDVFYERMEAGQTIWGGLTGGAWQYIGSQGVLQGAYETFMSVAREHFDGSLANKFILTSGVGGMGSAQPVAIRMTGAVGLIVEVDSEKLDARLANGVVDEIATDLSAALNRVREAQKNHESIVVGLAANTATVYPEILRLGIVPDVVTDMTAAHDARYGYVPEEVSVAEWAGLREADPVTVEKQALTSMAKQVEAMLRLQQAGSVVFESGNNLRIQAQSVGVGEAFDISGFAERYIRPLFCQGIGPFRWVALSGKEQDLAKLDEVAASLFPERPEVAKWIELARNNVAIQGLPARSCWLGHTERSRMAVEVNSLVAAGEISAPVLFSRDHLDSAGMTHPFIGTEKMADGSDFVSDWPLLDAMLLCSTGADLVAVHAGGGGYSGLMQSAGVSIVADGTPEAEQRLQYGLDGDTGLGVSRYAEAGYALAAESAHKTGIRRVTVA